MKARLRLFGEFRNFTDSAEIEVPVNDGFTVEDLKSQAAVQLGKLRPGYDLERLLSRSAVADENRILDPKELIGDHRWFALLPPVSGG
jgi:molybdopterin converting factor small subunit